MKIENETQAKAVKAKRDALRALDAAFENQRKHPEIDMLEAALAAYESRDKVKKIVEGLSERERAAVISLCEGLPLHLVKKGVCVNYTYANGEECLTPIGKEVAAYLRSQKRELKWEVHCDSNFCEPNPFRGAFECKAYAEAFACAMRRDNPNLAYEVREVK